MARFLKTMIPAAKLLVEQLPMGLEFGIDVPMRMPIGFLSFKKKHYLVIERLLVMLKNLNETCCYSLSLSVHN